MRVTLEPHPDSFAPGLRIEAEAQRAASARLILRYVVTGKTGTLLMPPPAAPGRADGLWRHTCFEAFVRAPAEAGYFELNFSPSGQWAAYRFSDYRAGMMPIDALPPPEIEAQQDGGRYILAASLDLAPILGRLAEAPWQLGLAAVIETRDGGKSYWAAAHPPGEPDFHHRDCFALELPPPKHA
jgi:hypothetical protein